MRASSFETARSLSSGAHSRDPLALLIRMRSWTLMVRSAATPRVSNHEAAVVIPIRPNQTVFWKAPSGLQRRGHLARDLNQRGNQRRHRIALRNNHPNTVVYDGIDNRNAADGISKPERLRELCRHHARPAAGPDVGIENQQRVRGQRRCRLCSYRTEGAIDDAPALDVRRQQT